jgi:hypothetical protein
MPDSATPPASPRRANFWSTLSLALICATIAFIAWQFMHHTQTHPSRRLWTPVVVGPDGSETALQAGTRRLEFWTPSAKTKDYLAGDGGAIRDRDKWEATASDERVQQFGSLLRTNSNVLGYRRTEVWGHGRTGLKPGWWWTTTVTTNYTVLNLMQAYRGFWKSTNAVFVEKIENPGEE